MPALAATEPVGFLPAARNLLKAWLLLAGFSAAVGGLGWWIGGYRTASISVFCVLLAAAALYWYLDRVAPGMVGAREMAIAEGPLLRSTVERLAAKVGVARPRLYLIPDAHPRAFAAGRGPRGSSLTVSAGLLTVTQPAELEGILAHELVHIANRDVLVQTTVSVLAGFLIEVTRLAGWFQRGFLFVLAPVAASFVHLFALAEQGVRGRQSGGGDLGDAARPRRRAHPSRGRRLVGRVRRQPRDGAALHGQSVRRRGHRRHVRHSSPARRAGTAPPGARPGVAREAGSRLVELLG